jgi:hypothetical protein
MIENNESKIVTCLDHTVVTDSMVDVEMSDAEDGVTMTSETDLLADFLPPPLTRKCSDELQVHHLFSVMFLCHKNK